MPARIAPPGFKYPIAVTIPPRITIAPARTPSAGRAESTLISETFLIASAMTRRSNDNAVMAITAPMFPRKPEPRPLIAFVTSTISVSMIASIARPFVPACQSICDSLTIALATISDVNAKISIDNELNTDTFAVGIALRASTNTPIAPAMPRIPCTSFAGSISLKEITLF